MAPRSILVPLLLAPALAGCGGAAYTPRASPRVQTVGDGMSMTLVRNGQRYPVGMFGSGLEDAVRGNPRAEAEASKYTSKTIAGFVLSLVGTGVSVGGAAWVVAPEVQHTGDTTSRVGGLSMMIGGLVVSLVASAVMSSAPVHLWNAINMYNDDLPAPWGFGPQYPMPGLPGYGPRGYSPAPYAPGYGPYPAPPSAAPQPPSLQMTPLPPSAPPPSAPPPSAPPPSAPPPPPSAPPPAPPAPPP